MKYIPFQKILKPTHRPFAILLFIILVMACKNSNNGNCYPNKGIKSAKITATKESATESSPKVYKEIHYNDKGQPTWIKEPNSKEYKRVYAEGHLQYIVTTGPAPHISYTSVDQKENSNPNSGRITDTAIVVNTDNFGRPLAMKNSNGETWIFEYTRCDSKLVTTINSIGDTLQQMQSNFKDGVLTETIWTPFFPTKSYSSSKYFGYKYNAQGHWIKRSYHYSDQGVITENRIIDYY